MGGRYPVCFITIDSLTLITALDQVKIDIYCEIFLCVMNFTFPPTNDSKGKMSSKFLCQPIVICICCIQIKEIHNFINSLN